jgi:hypothetical protein
VALLITKQLIIIVAVAVRDWEYMIEHGQKAGDDISKDLFVPTSTTWLSQKFMVDADVIEGDRSTSYKALDPIPGITYLPGGQRRYVNAKKEEDRKEKLRAIEEERRKKEVAVEEERQKRSWQARLERSGCPSLGELP